MSHKSAAPRKVQCDGGFIVCSQSGVMKFKSVLRGFLYTGHCKILILVFWFQVKEIDLFSFTWYNAGSLGDIEKIAKTCTTGISVYSTLLIDSDKRQFLRSHPAPSRYKPNT